MSVINNPPMPFWLQISPELKKCFEMSQVIKNYKRGDVIYRSGETPQGIYIVEKGLVCLLIIGENSGKEHLMRFFKEGDFFGHRSLFSNEAYHATTKALDTTVLKFIPTHCLQRILDENPALYRQFLVFTSKELRQGELQRVNILENQILPRVAQSLVYLKEIDPEHNWTRQEIADFCASTVSTVIRALGDLEERGLIVQNGRSIDVIKKTELINLQD